MARPSLRLVNDSFLLQPHWEEVGKSHETSFSEAFSCVIVLPSVRCRIGDSGWPMDLWLGEYSGQGSLSAWHSWSDNVAPEHVSMRGWWGERTARSLLKIYLCTCMCIWVAGECSGGCQIPWSCSDRQLRATWCGLWEQSLQEQQTPLSAECCGTRPICLLTVKPVHVIELQTYTHTHTCKQSRANRLLWVDHSSVKILVGALNYSFQWHPPGEGSHKTHGLFMSYLPHRNVKQITVSK